MFPRGEADDLQSWTILRRGSAEAGGCHHAAQVRLRASTNTRREIISVAVVGDTETEHHADGAAEGQQHECERRGVMHWQCTIVLLHRLRSLWRLGKKS